MLAVTQPATDETRQRHRPRLLRYALHAAVLVGLMVAATKYVSGKEFLRALWSFDWQYAPPILLLTVAYVLIKGGRFVSQLDQLSHANRTVLMCGYVAGQACTLLPGGMAARAGILQQVGVRVEDSAASIALSSTSDQVVLMACSLLSALWFEAARQPALILLSILIAISALLGIEATRTWLLEVIEWLMGRVRLLIHWRRFLNSLHQISSLPVLLRAVANAALAFALMVVALDLAARGAGAEIRWSTLLLAFTLPTMLGRISAMPGGVGVTEAGMVGILDAAPGVTLHQAATAAVVFRVGTVLFAAVLGAVVYFLAWRGRAEAVEAQTAEEPQMG
jgi:uncharacterized membrane protein YbhN (UPF0104 family)